VSKPVVLYNARGSGQKLDLTSERVRQLFKAGKIPVVAYLNGKSPLTDDSSLMAVKREREEQRKARTAV